MSAWDDPRVRRGMQQQLAWRRERLAAGEKQIGWKVGFGAPAIMTRLGIEKPLVGFLTDRARVDNGGTVSLTGWIKPVAEPEVAVYMGTDLPAGANANTVKASIASIGPAIELADLDPPPELDTLEVVLAGNIFQRHVVLGAPDRSRASANLQGLTGRVFRGSTEIARTSDVMANTGEPIALVRHVADMLAAFGERLRAGEFIITGSVVPPLFIEANDEGVLFELVPVGSVSVRFSRR
jgi:2-keto-4-pentenoate hydratase